MRKRFYKCVAVGVAAVLAFPLPVLATELKTPVQKEAKAETAKIQSLQVKADAAKVQISGTCTQEVVAIVVQIRDAAGNIVTMESHPAGGGEFAADIAISLSAGDYTAFVADYAGGVWKTMDFSIKAPSEGEGGNTTPGDSDTGKDDDTKPGDSDTGKDDNTKPGDSDTGKDDNTKPGDSDTDKGDATKPGDSKPIQKPVQDTDQAISVGSATTNADGSVTNTSTVYDKNGTVTTTEVTTHANGTVSETKTTTVPGVSVTTVETTKNTDGSSKTKEVVANVDGSVAVTTTTVNVDGSAKIVAQKNAVNDFGNVQEKTKTTNMDAAGVVTGITEKTVIPEAAKNTKVSVVVKKTGADVVTSAKATVETTVAKSKATILGAVVNQVNAAAGTATEIMVKVSDKNGKTLYKLKADSSELKAGNTLYAYQLNTKTGEYTVVNAKTYKVNKNGSVAVDMTKKATFELVSKKEAAAIDKQILSTVRVKKASASVKAGKKTAVAMSSKLNMSNVKSITYKTSEASVATVSKSGKITAKQAGTTVVKATVTLKNGKKKTVKMTITVE